MLYLGKVSGTYIGCTGDSLQVIVDAITGDVGRVIVVLGITHGCYVTGVRSRSKSVATQMMKQNMYSLIENKSETLGFFSELHEEVTTITNHSVPIP